MRITIESEASGKHLTAREFVLEGIRHAMLDGSLVAGQALDDHALAESFGVSRTPVREALKVLEVQGFVTHRPFAKPVVASVSLPHIDEVFLMRVALEGAAVARACLAIDEAELKYLDRCAESGRKAIAKQDAPAWSRWNREFHKRLAAVAGMPLLSREIDSLVDLSSFYSTVCWSEILEAFSGAQMEHQHVVQACRERNPELARTLMEKHLAASCAVQMRFARRREAVEAAAAVDPSLSPPKRGGAVRRRRAKRK